MIAFVKLKKSFFCSSCLLHPVYSTVTVYCNIYVYTFRIYFAAPFSRYLCCCRHFVLLNPWNSQASRRFIELTEKKANNVVNNFKWKEKRTKKAKIMDDWKRPQHCNLRSTLNENLRFVAVFYFQWEYSHISRFAGASFFYTATELNDDMKLW